jgi:peptidoglycan hydrolase-like protein with peptidoglycan-binding domain
MRLPLIAATLMFLCALSANVAAQATAGQASSSSSSTKPVTHKKKHHSLKRQPAQKAPTADRISEIQSALARKGYYQGEPNGKWDANTVAALQKFQSENGIDSGGKLDAPTLQKLGLGSDIAGVSAPKRAAPPSCCSMNPDAPSTQTSAPVANSAVAENSSTPGAASAPSSKPTEH